MKPMEEKDIFIFATKGSRGFAIVEDPANLFEGCDEQETNFYSQGFKSTAGLKEFTTGEPF